ncbi:MAG: hypothetical protein QOD04_227, partial [Pseudonocardiales bacterium]|nr:hypothetical protein [Pseudonocardiales bacterium]
RLMTDTATPLAGYRVLSLAEQYPGPFATLLLSDLGADVIQLERPGGDPARRYPEFYAALNRGKRSAAVDLKHPGGVAAVAAMAARADVVLEGFRPGVLDRLGLGAEQLTAANPALVHVSISGFGQTGPYRDRPAHDLTYQAMAGLLDETQAARNELPLLSLADLTAGLFAAIAALTGLAGRAGSGGRGGRYDVSMFESLVSLMTTHLVPAANGGDQGSLGQDPGYGFYATSDRRWLSLSIAFEDHFWRRLCAALGLDRHAAVDGEQRVSRRVELRTELAGVFALRPLAEWERVLTASGVPFGAVQSPETLLGDPHLAGHGMLRRVPDRTDQRVYLRQPLVVDGSYPGPRSGCPRLGEHTAEALAEAGLTNERIAELIAAGAAAVAGALTR